MRILIFVVFSIIFLFGIMGVQESFAETGSIKGVVGLHPIVDFCSVPLSNIHSYWKLDNFILSSNGTIQGDIFFNYQDENPRWGSARSGISVCKIQTRDNVLQFTDNSLVFYQVWADFDYGGMLPATSNEPLIPLKPLFPKNLNSSSIEVSINDNFDLIEFTKEYPEGYGRFPDVLRVEISWLRIFSTPQDNLYYQWIPISGENVILLNERNNIEGQSVAFSPISEHSSRKFYLFDYNQWIKENINRFSPLPPLQQWKMGIELHEISCHRDLELIFKATDKSPACVKLETAIKLYKRGWAKSMENDAWQKWAENIAHNFVISNLDSQYEIIEDSLKVGNKGQRDSLPPLISVGIAFSALNENGESVNLSFDVLIIQGDKVEKVQAKLWDENWENWEVIPNPFIEK